MSTGPDTIKRLPSDFVFSNKQNTFGGSNFTNSGVGSKDTIQNGVEIKENSLDSPSRKKSLGKLTKQKLSNPSMRQTERPQPRDYP